MIERSLKLGEVLGIPIRLHVSWWFIFLLLSWSLATSFFPQVYLDQTSLTYWALGVIAALMLFVSVLLHELSHSLVARLRKIRVESITLFFFGGVSGITDEEIKPSSEFVMALAGPLFSVFLSGVFFALTFVGFPLFLEALFFYLFELNFILAIFNMLPAYPLDGGRAFRALLEWHFKDLVRSTKIAAFFGKLFSVLLVGLGILGITQGFGGGFWFILLGSFLFLAAGASYQQVLVKQELSKIHADEVMRKKVPVIAGDMLLSDLIETYRASNEDIFHVKAKHYEGILDMRQIGMMSPKMLERVEVRRVALPLRELPTVTDHNSAWHAYRKCVVNKLGVVGVSHKSKIIGFVSLTELYHLLNWEKARRGVKT